MSVLANKVHGGDKIKIILEATALWNTIPPKVC